MTRLPTGPRLALAADLNDLITHRVAAVQVQAAAAERLLTGTEPGAAAAIVAVRGLTAEAMDELRRLARLLDDGAPLSLEPAPSALPGVAEPLPGGVALCAYRCVEALAGMELSFHVTTPRSRSAATGWSASGSSAASRPSSARATAG